MELRLCFPTNFPSSPAPGSGLDAISLGWAEWLWRLWRKLNSQMFLGMCKQSANPANVEGGSDDLSASTTRKNPARHLAPAFLNCFCAIWLPAGANRVVSAMDVVPLLETVQKLSHNCNAASSDSQRTGTNLISALSACSCIRPHHLNFRLESMPAMWRSLGLRTCGARAARSLIRNGHLVFAWSSPKDSRTMHGSHISSLKSAPAYPEEPTLGLQQTVCGTLVTLRLQNYCVHYFLGCYLNESLRGSDSTSAGRWRRWVHLPLHRGPQEQRHQSSSP